MAVAPPVFRKINIPEVQRLGLEYDTRGYDASDEDFKTRFPDLWRARQYNANDSAAQLAGAQDPLVAATLEQAGLQADYGDTPYAQARNMGMELPAKEKRDRNFLSRLLATNPQRQQGIYDTADTLKMISYNTAGINNLNQAAFGSRVNEYNNMITNQALQQAAYANAATDLTRAIAGGYQNRQSQTQAGYYGAAGVGGMGSGGTAGAWGFQ